MKLFNSILLLIISVSCYAQNRTLTGKIFDSYQSPLSGVYVFNINTQKHTHTLENGSFSLSESAPGDSLNIRLLGFKTKNVLLKEEDFTKPVVIYLENKIFQLDELILTQEIDPIRIINKIDLQTNPVRSSQEILRQVPGLFVGQHAGGGKAEQIFLRGFDVDHGTDVAISVDGMPVNMVSHAHGQGYADLHFVIPETIQKVDFGKGPHYANQGNFNTAGYVAFKTKERFNTNQIKIELGDFNTFRTLGTFNLTESAAKDDVLLAVEYLESDGPFESPQNFNRINLAAKYTTLLNDNNKLSVSASQFTSRWDASGQIPERAVADGSISRFGAIDDTEGGATSRTNLNFDYHKFLSDRTVLNTQAYVSAYDFTLFSNFTFFLNDSVNGDQIRQFEDRMILGFNQTLNSRYSLSNTEVMINAGVGFRNDATDDTELSRTKNRNEILDVLSLGTINETNIHAFTDVTLEWKKFKITPALRLDYFKNVYEDALQDTYENKNSDAVIVSPKLQASYDVNNKLNLFAKSGIGFHSNDTRVVVEQNGEKTLPKAYGLDVGINWKPFPKLFLNTTGWYLGLEQEFVYVGDEGIVEPSGETRRLGMDISARYQLIDWLFFNSDFTYTKARSLEAADGEDFIPLAPKITAAGGLSVDNYKNISGGIRFRHLGDRAANEDNSIIAEGYTVADMNVNYTWKKMTLGLAAENIFDVEWKEAQFATESRLRNETEPVEEIHFTPGTPFFLKASITYSF